MSKALLFINGENPDSIPENTNSYSIITCTDGAYTRYVQNLPISVDYISGDMDSINLDKTPDNIEIIFTPDQNKTDFHKALEILLKRGMKEVDIYGGTGRESDHFIGNLSTALYFKDKIKITFYDNYSKFFFSDRITQLNQVRGKIISLIPFFETKNVITKGLKYPLNNEDLSFKERIGTRNLAEDDNISVSYTEGELLIFIEK